MFEKFVAKTEPRLRAGLVAAYGPEVGQEATADAMAYCWEHWERLRAMTNPAGYLFRVGQTSARRSRNRQGHLPAPDTQELPHFEPGLVPALGKLTESQRVCVLAVHAFGWTQVEVGELLDVDPSTVRTHLARGLRKLQLAFEVEPHV